MSREPEATLCHPSCIYWVRMGAAEQVGGVESMTQMKAQARAWQRTLVALALGALITVVCVHTPTAEAADGTYDIFVMNPDGADRHAWSADDLMPSWSRDGRIVFIRATPGGRDPALGARESMRLWLMDADGTGDTYVPTDPARWHLHPAWSPDGMR